MSSPHHLSITQAKLNVVYRKLEERTTYVKKHCMMSRSMKCKAEWMEIKRLHGVAARLEKRLAQEEGRDTDDKNHDDHRHVP